MNKTEIKKAEGMMADFVKGEIQPKSWTWEYSTSWDALMEVVEKIKEIGASIHIELSGLYYKESKCTITHSNKYTGNHYAANLMRTDHTGQRHPTMLKALFVNCAEFIESYTTNDKLWRNGQPYKP